jgi:3-dehydroquinate dehydratase I
MTKANGVMRIEEIIHAEPARLLVFFDHGQDDIVKIVADVLGQAYSIVDSLDDVVGWSDGVVVGLRNDLTGDRDQIARTPRTTITCHAIDIRDLRDEDFTSYCDYEYLYTQAKFSRRDLARFLGFVLGQIKPHDNLAKKSRTTLLSTTFPDIRGALPNLDILSVGADSIELRVDLLKEPSVNGANVASGAVPSLKYVGEQVMVLRQRTELPIIFTTRCTNENGRFPMDDPTLFHRYLRKAMQWGCEYIDGTFRIHYQSIMLTFTDDCSGIVASRRDPPYTCRRERQQQDHLCMARFEWSIRVVLSRSTPAVL